MSQLVSEFFTSQIRHPSIIFSIIDFLVVSFWGILLIPILSLYKINMKSFHSCVHLEGLTKYLLLNITFTGIPKLTNLYLSENLVFICFGTMTSSPKSISLFNFLRIGFTMIALTDTSLLRLKGRISFFLVILVTCYI